MAVALHISSTLDQVARKFMEASTASPALIQAGVRLLAEEVAAIAEPAIREATPVAQLREQTGTHGAVIEHQQGTPGKLRESTETEVMTTETGAVVVVTQGAQNEAGQHYWAFVSSGHRAFDVYPRNKSALWWPGALHPVRGPVHIPAVGPNRYIDRGLAAATPAIDEALSLGSRTILERVCQVLK